VPQVSLRVTTAIQYSVDTDKVEQFFFKVNKQEAQSGAPEKEKQKGFRA
jgi:hypothetical protein